MRVAIFFDGKNFYTGFKDQAGERIIDFRKLSTWLVEKVGGSVMTGAHYYTGIEPEGAGIEPAKLTGFLNMLEMQPGYFVYRFPRKKRTASCRKCADVATYTTEKEVDTTMVADMLRLAAVNAFDVLILLSGDSDHAPAIEGVRHLGKIAYVSTWGGIGLSTRLRKASFDHIDLKNGLDIFAPDENNIQQSLRLPSAPVSTKPDDGASAFITELAQAEKIFGSKHVGIHYFITKWRSPLLVEDPIIRRRILNRLAKENKIELYDAPNGDKSMRIKI